MKISLNLNERVYIRVTEAGHKHWIEYWRKQGVPDKYRRILQNDLDGWTQISLWELMQVFGSQMYMGNPKVMFENNEVQFRYEI